MALWQSLRVPQSGPCHLSPLSLPQNLREGLRDTLSHDCERVFETPSRTTVRGPQDTLSHRLREGHELLPHVCHVSHAGWFVYCHVSHVADLAQLTNISFQLSLLFVDEFWLQAIEWSFLFRPVKFVPFVNLKYALLKKHLTLFLKFEAILLLNRLEYFKYSKSTKIKNIDKLFDFEKFVFFFTSNLFFCLFHHHY